MTQVELFILIGAFVLLVFTTIVIYLVISNQKNVWKEQNKMQLYKFNQQQKLTRAIIEAQEKERERIAKDLHDEIGGLAVSLKLNNDAIQEHLNDPEYLEKIRKKNDELANEIIKTGRQVSYDLLPPLIRKNGLVNALKCLIEDLSNPDQTLINFEFPVKEIRLDEIAEISIYRVMKEWTHNVLKYSNASELTISMSYCDQKLKILSKDNGNGFDFENVRNRSRGLGLMNMEGRLNDLNAEFEFNSKNGSGTELRIEYALN